MLSRNQLFARLMRAYLTYPHENESLMGQILFGLSNSETKTLRMLYDNLEKKQKKDAMK